MISEDGRGVSARGDRFTCCRCGKVKRVRSRCRRGGKEYCRICFASVTGRVPQFDGCRGRIKLKDAVKKVRNVSSYYPKGKNSVICVLSLPSCYSGKKVRVVVVEDEDGS